MGGCDFEVFVDKGVMIGNAAQAYEHAVQQAVFSYGNEGYSGTIKEKSGYRMKKPNPVSMLEAVAIKEDFDSWYQNHDKWGPAECLTICEAETKTRTITKTLKLFTEDAIRPDHPVLLQVLKLPTTQTITGIKVLSDDRKYRAVAKCNTGKVSRIFRSGKVTHETVADALAAIKAEQERRIAHVIKTTAEHPEWSHVGNIAGSEHVTEVVERGGLPAATSTITMTSRKVKVEVSTVQQMGSTASDIKGWLFFGIASC